MLYQKHVIATLRSSFNQPIIKTYGSFHKNYRGSVKSYKRFGKSCSPAVKSYEGSDKNCRPSVKSYEALAKLTVSPIKVADHL